jgi:hypothetical protein
VSKFIQQVCAKYKHCSHIVNQHEMCFRVMDEVALSSCGVLCLTAQVGPQTFQLSHSNPTPPWGRNFSFYIRARKGGGGGYSPRGCFLVVTFCVQCKGSKKNKAVPLRHTVAEG